MSRNDIRLRRSPRGAERFRNYDAVLQRREREHKIKRIVRVFSIFAIILILVMLIVILSRFEKKEEHGYTPETADLIAQLHVRH